MQSKKLRVNGRDNIVNLAALIGFGVFVAQILEMNAVVSVLFACSFICVAVNYLTFISARNRLRLDDIALFLLTLLSIVLSDWQLNFDYYKPAIVVVCTVLCIDQCAEIQADEKTCKRVAFWLVLVGVLTVYLYYFGDLGRSFLGDLLILNFSNPNAAAMWLVFLVVLLCDSVSMQKGLLMKLAALACAAIFLLMLYQTQSRNCLFAIVFYLVGKTVLHFFQIKRLPKWVVFFIVMAPILVYVGYMYIFIPYYDYFSEWFLFLVSEGKPLTSRSRIWSDLEMNQIKHILFGNYGVYYTEQLHNSMVTVYCRFGIFFVMVVCRKLYRAMKKMSNAGIQLAMGTVWLTGCFEASIFVGVAGMYMLVLLLPVFHFFQLDNAEKNRMETKRRFEKN